MKIVSAVAPTIEPISLAEFKLHLRADSGTFADNISEEQSLAPGNYAVAADYTTHVGSSVGVAGYSVLVQLNSGTNSAGATVDCKIQESDDDAAWSDWDGGAFTQVTTVNDNAIQEIEYTGTKAYVRTVAKVLVGTCDFGTTVILISATTSEDSLLNNDIQGAREHVEDITRRALLTQTWDYYLPAFPYENSFKVPFGNLQSVTHIKYTDSDGDQTTMTAGTDYIVETNGEYCGRIVLPYGGTWPAFTAYPSNPIVVRFVAGWTAAASIPYKIRAACLLIAAGLYGNREGYFQNAFQLRTSTIIGDMLSTYRLWDEFI